MKAAQIIKYGGAEAITFNENVQAPTIASGKVIVEVHAAGINPFDWKVRAGYFEKMIPLQFPTILGGDFSGAITEVGEGVLDFQKGDEVFGSASILNGGSGSLAEYDLADVKTIAHKPKNVNHLEAAALPLAAVSAIQALIEHISLNQGQKILIHGGAGGIGSFAIQLAKHLGAYVATTVSTNHIDYVKNLGADEVIDYKNQAFENILKDYDAVFDAVGGEVNAKSYQVLRKGGILVSMTEKPNNELMQQYEVNAMAQQTAVNADRLIKLAELVEQGAIKVHIDKVFPLEQAGTALTYLQDGHVRGKVVVEVNKG